MHELTDRGALGAMRATVDRTIPGGLLANPNPVDDFRGDGAANRAVRADILLDVHIRARDRAACGARLLYRAELDRADGGETACGKAGAAQKGAAIDALAREARG